MRADLRNTNGIIGHPDCTLCSYSGFSNDCMFFETGSCPYGLFLNDVRKRTRLRAYREELLSGAPPILSGMRELATKKA